VSPFKYEIQSVDEDRDEQTRDHIFTAKIHVTVPIILRARCSPYERFSSKSAMDHPRYQLENNLHYLTRSWDNFARHMITCGSEDLAEELIRRIPPARRLAILQSTMAEVLSSDTQPQH
jgi:hypothetical protein